MARLPEALPDPIAGARIPAIGVGATDLGLSQLAAGVASYGEEMAKADKVVAGRRLLELQKLNETELNTAAATYTGEDAGFADGQIARAQERAFKALQDPSLTRGQRRELNELANNEISRVGRLAISHEATTRAKPLAELTAAADQATGNKAITQYLTTVGPKLQEMKDGFDGSDRGYQQRVAALVDETQAAVMATVPERLRGQVLAKLDAEGVRTKAEAATTEQLGVDRYVLKSGQDQVDQLMNGILGNPGSHASVVAALPGIVETMPLGLRKGIMHEWMGMAAEARVTALINRGELAQADQELNDEGRYDDDLKPQVKEQLQNKIESAQRYHAPRTLDEAMAAQALATEMDADVYAIQTTGQSTGRVNVADAVRLLSPTQTATYAAQVAQAHKAFAALGPLQQMTNPELDAAMAAPPPDPSDPEYASKIGIYQTFQTAGKLEKEARKDGATRAFTIQPKPKAGGAQAQDAGAALQQNLQSFLGATPGPAQAAAGVTLATTSLGQQYRLGIDPAARGIMPKATIEALAATVTNAAPENQAQALINLSSMIAALPRAVSMPDGSTAAPQAMMLSDLRKKGHLSPVWATALQDFGGNPTLMGRFVTAMIEAKGAEALTSQQSAALRQATVTELEPLLATLAPLPGALEDSKARVDRTVLMAGWHIRHEHLSTAAAAKAAAGELTAGYRYVDTWRMPAGTAAAQVQVRTPNPDGRVGGVQTRNRDGESAARAGAGRMMAELLSADGAMLYPARGTAPSDRKAYVAAVRHSAHWVTAADDTGLVLMVPNPDHTWSPVADKWGQSVRASWSELGAQASFDAPSRFAKPPVAVLRNPAGQPVAAISKQAAFNYVAKAVTWQESRNVPGLKSPAGALGLMQVMPDTVKDYAPRLNLPVDLERARHDNAYNQRIGQAALLDHINHFGSGAGLVLAIASYNAGRGRVEGRTVNGIYQKGWIETLGDPRKGRITTDQWVERIPYPETREYVKAVLGRAVGYAQAGGR